MRTGFVGCCGWMVVVENFPLRLRVLSSGSQFRSVVCGWLLQWNHLSSAYQDFHGARRRSYGNWNRQALASL